MKRPLLQSIIFSHGEGYSSEAARIYTDIILKFADTVKIDGRAISREFKDYELANWLLDNNNDFKNYYIGDRSHIRKANSV